MKRILVVEDDKFLSRVLSEKLSGDGYEVVTAFNGEEGLEEVKKKKPDLLLVDLIMPVKDGFDFLEELQAQKLAAGLPIIVSSNLGQEADMKRTKELGAVDYFVKSNTPLHEVVEKVKAHLK